MCLHVCHEVPEHPGIDRNPAHRKRQDFVVAHAPALAFRARYAFAQATRLAARRAAIAGYASAVVRLHRVNSLARAAKHTPHRHPRA